MRSTSQLPLDLLGAPKRRAITRRRRLVLWGSVIGAAVGCVLIVVVTRDRQRGDLREMVRQAALEEGLDPRLAEAVVQAESAWNPRARSRAGARGLMQLMLGTARELAGRPLGEQELYEPRLNARLGCRYLRRLLRSYQGDLLLALMAYNAGPGNLKKWLRLDPDPRVILEQHAFRDTRAYVTKVLRTLKG